MIGRRSRVALALALVVLAVAPAVALAHPLGNFTINHFAGIRVGQDRIDLDVVIDRAEIPTFQERQALDTNGDGTVSADEIEAARQAACGALSTDLTLTAGGVPQELQVRAAGISFPMGAGGLFTMRLVCEYSVALAAPIGAGTPVTFDDRSFGERIGWREIVAAGDRVSLAVVSGETASVPRPDADPMLQGVSTRLTLYPKDLLTQPLDERSMAVTASQGGPASAAWTAPDAEPLDHAAPAGSATTPAVIAAVPGGIGTELSSIIDAQDLTPAIVLGSLLVAIALGAAHALSPGHGKTIMAAYLVGTRGTARHAIGLGLTVTISHTLGVMGLAGVTLLAARILPPERLYPVLGVLSGGLVILIGGSLLVARLRAARGGANHAASARGAGHPVDESGHPTQPAHEHSHDHGHGHDLDHDHDHDIEAGRHSHGGRAHSHVPAPGTTLSWRSLFALGLSGGLVPSASALILLLGSISAGRIGYGIVLVFGFGIGMAVILGGVGLVLVRASHLVERLPSGGAMRRLPGIVQLATAGLVMVLGVFLTGQALTQVL